MKYDFDTVIDRHGTDCIKFDFAAKRGHSEDELSYWVADMDFKTAPEVINAVRERVENGIFGYTDPSKEYFASVRNWIKDRFDYDTEFDWLFVTPGIVFAIGAAIQAYTEKGDAVLINNPVYYPFAGTVRASGRKVVSSDLIWDGTGYRLDLKDFEEKIRQEKPKLYLLCNPHNPGGKNWSREELYSIGEICLKYGVTVLSDEIHADFTWDTKGHTVFASLSKEIEDITVTCTSPSKSFNLAGLQISNIFVSNKEMRKKFSRAVDTFGYSQANVLGLTACRAAYDLGKDWLDAVSNYIEENLEKSVAFFHEKLPKVKVTKPEATYLLWVDFSGFGLSDAELNRIVREEAKVWIDGGYIFGKSGEGFIRINVACSWAYLEQGLLRLAEAFKNL